MTRRDITHRPDLLTLLALIPAEGWVTQAHLATRPGVTTDPDGRVLGLRKLRSSSAIIARHDDDGTTRFARTPTGTAALARVASRPA